MLSLTAKTATLHLAHGESFRCKPAQPTCKTSAPRVPGAARSGVMLTQMVALGTPLAFFLSFASLPAEREATLYIQGLVYYFILAWKLAIQSRARLYPYLRGWGNVARRTKMPTSLALQALQRCTLNSLSRMTCGTGGVIQRHDTSRKYCVSQWTWMLSKNI